MNALDLYNEAGKPDRAIITFDRPTRIAASLSRMKIVTRFEAWLTVGNGRGDKPLAFYYNKRSIHAFYMPDNVIKIKPVDTMELWCRARKAADYIRAGQTHGRELDNAFENYDGEEMCCALYRMALKSPKLLIALKKEWSAEGSFVRTFAQAGMKFHDLPDKQLSEHAKQTRMKRGEA